MSRKIKYDVDFKLQVVGQILKGKESVDSLSIKFNITDSLIKSWVHFYRLHGDYRPQSGDLGFNIDLNETDTLKLDSAMVFTPEEFFLNRELYATPIPSQNLKLPFYALTRCSLQLHPYIITNL